MQIITLRELKIFLARSKLRVIVLKKIKEDEQIASFLGKDIKKHRETISRIFKDLVKMKLAKCLNYNEPNFRRYKITKIGEEILKEIKEI